MIKRTISAAAAVLAAAVLAGGALAPAAMAMPGQDAQSGQDGGSAGTVAAGALASTAVTPPARGPQSEPDGSKAAPVNYCIVDTMPNSRIPRKICHTRADWIARTGEDPVKDAAK